MSINSIIGVPLLRQGYAIFVKLWDLTTDSPADEARFLFDVLDEALLSVVSGENNSWFASPYGGAVLLPDVDGCLAAAALLIAALNSVGALISIGVAWGHFERVYDVNHWNAAAEPLNTAARLAFLPGIEGLVAIHPKVKNDAYRSSARHHGLFSPEKHGIVKGSQFSYHILLAERFRQKLHNLVLAAGRPSSDASIPANIVSFDIEQYSRRSQSEQAELMAVLSVCTEMSLSRVGKKRDSWVPAGDGGQLVFPSQSESSSTQAWTFAQLLRLCSLQRGLPLRIGADNGPVLKSKHRPAVGGALLRADEVSSHAPAHGIALSHDFWAGLPGSLKIGIEIAPSHSDPQVFIVSELGAGRDSIYLAELDTTPFDFTSSEQLIKRVGALPVSRELLDYLLRQVDPTTGYGREDPTERYFLYHILRAIGGREAEMALRLGVSEDSGHAQVGAREALERFLNRDLSWP